jgi:hypothetical protein
MNAALEQFEKGSLILFVLFYVIVHYFDRAVRKVRLESLFGVGVEPVAFPNGGVESDFFRVAFLFWVVVKFFDDVLLRPVVRSHPDWSSGWRAAFIVLLIAVPIMVGVLFFFWWRRRPTGVFPLSRGLLHDTVGRMTETMTLSGWIEMPVWVLPDSDGARTCARLGRGVVVPLSLLDQLSRKEIDAIVARQLCLQRRSFPRNLLWTMLAPDVGAVVALGVLHAGVVISCLVYASLLVAELYVLSRRLPRIFIQADLRAISLTGDSESFFSALRGLERFGGKPLAPEVLQQIVIESGMILKRDATPGGVSPDTELERYPTSGSYLLTGF